MSQDILSNMGFNLVTVKEPVVAESDKILLDVSVIKPDDHKHPQIVFKLPRHILTQLKWEITDRVKVMSKPGSKKIALVKASKKETNTFAISTQGTSVENAKLNKRGGVVKVGWRNQMCESPSVFGTHSSQTEMLDSSLIVKLPATMFV